MIQRLLIGALVVAASSVAGCATLERAPTLRAQHALGVRRVLVLAVSFPGIEPGRTPSVKLPPDATIDVVSQGDTELTLKVTRR